MILKLIVSITYQQLEIFFLSKISYLGHEKVNGICKINYSEWSVLPSVVGITW
jgi:hypothetical protein